MSTLPHNAADANLEAPAAMANLSAAGLDAVIQHFINTADALAAPRPATDELAEMVHQIAGFTRELFLGKLTIETSVDPEIRDDVCLLVHVETSNGIDDVLAMHDTWHRRVLPIAPKFPGLFRLSIDSH